MTDYGNGASADFMPGDEAPASPRHTTVIFRDPYPETQPGRKLPILMAVTLWGKHNLKSAIDTLAEQELFPQECSSLIELRYH